MKNISVFLLLAIILSACSPTLAAPLQDGDRVVFCGDSITDLKIYTRFVMDYFTLRDPGNKIIFYNVGVTGSTAGGWKTGGIQQHVLPLKPTVVSICLGMNDGGYRAYEEKTGDEYEANLLSLITQIRAGGARVVLLTPGAIDDDVIPAKYGKGIYNDTLNKLAKRVEALAAREHLPVFNIHDPMLQVEQRAKAETPAFTMIPDGVHPRDVGSTVMAYGLLKALDAVTPAAGVRIDTAAKTAAANLCTVTELTVADDRVTFTRTDQALPSYFPPEALKAIGKYTTIFDEMNDYRLAISGLKAGEWKLQVENKPVGTYSADELANGVNLGNAPGPWQTPAMKIDEQNKDAGHVYDVVFHGLSARHFPQPADADSPELKQCAAEIETARVAYIKKVDSVYEADELAHAVIPEAERTWHWVLVREP